MSFVAGAHVFPGGTHRRRRRPRRRDRDVATGSTRRRAFRTSMSQASCACRVAAARELVEEAGVLLARATGRWATSDEAEALRRRLDEGVPFEQAVREGGWRLALDALVPFAQIVTPRSEPRRFDTHFFLRRAPRRAEAAPPTALSPTSSCGASPSRALGRRPHGEIVLLPPTWVTLMQLAAFDSVAALLAWGQARLDRAAGADVHLRWPASGADHPCRRGRTRFPLRSWTWPATGAHPGLDPAVSRDGGDGRRPMPACREVLDSEMMLGAPAASTARHRRRRGDNDGTD